MERETLKNQAVLSENNLTENEEGILSNPCLQKTCSIHAGNKFDYLSIDSTQECVFKCMFCVTDEDVQQYTLIPIKQIVAANNTTVFANYPLSDRALTKAVKQVIQSPPTGESLKQDIDKFFKDLRANIFAKLEAIQAKMEAKAQGISDLSSEIIQLYNSMSEKTNLQNILIDQQKPFENKISEIKSLCAKVKSKESENKQIIQQSLEKTKLLHEAIDFNSPKKIKEQILQQIEAIDMFLVEDMANFSEQLRSSPISRNDPNKNVQDIMKLVRNKMNGVQEESCKIFEGQLKRLSSVISCLEVPIVGPIYENIEALTSLQTKAIQDLVGEIKRLSTEGQLSEEESQTKEKTNLNDIIELVSNQINFCSTKQIQELTKVLSSLGGVLNLFRIPKLNPQSTEHLSFKNLEPDQLFNLSKLALKIKENSVQYVENQVDPKALNNGVQQNSMGVICSIQQSKSQFIFKQSLNQLLDEYSFFERAQKFQGSVNIISQIFTKTNYSHSINIQIAEENNQIKYSLNSSPGQVVSQILKNDCAYMLKLNFSHKFGSQQGDIQVGLIKNKVIDSRWIVGDTEASFLSRFDKGASIVTKGVRLGSQQQLKEINQLEFRWCISRRLFYISDSSYANINQVEEKNIIPTEQYRFGIGFYEFSGCKWTVTVTDFYEIDPDRINDFSNPLI